MVVAISTELYSISYIWMLRIFVSLWWKVQYSTDKSLKHGLGHSYQSQLLGWLYIPVIAIPSVLHNLVHYKLYYSFYTEKWADKLVEKVG